MLVIALVKIPSNDVIQLPDSQLGLNPPGSFLLLSSHPFAQIAAMSNSSFVSDLQDEHAHTEDGIGVIQIQQVAGRRGLTQTVTRLFPLGLSRTKFACILTPMSEATLFKNPPQLKPSLPMLFNWVQW